MNLRTCLTRKENFGRPSFVPKTLVYKESFENKTRSYNDRRNNKTSFIAEGSVFRCRLTNRIDEKIKRDFTPLGIKRPLNLMSSNIWSTRYLKTDRKYVSFIEK